VFAPSVESLTAQQVTGSSLPTQSVPVPTQSFAMLAQPRSAPRNVLSRAPTRRQQFGQQVRERGPIAGSLAFLGGKAQGAVGRVEPKGGQSFAATGFISTGVQVAPFFTPAGPALALGSSVELLGRQAFTERGKQQLKTTTADISGRTGLSPTVVTTGIIGAEFALGALGGVAASRQLTRAVGVPRAEATLLGTTGKGKQFTREPQTFIDGKTGEVRRVSKADIFNVDSTSDVLITGKTNIFLPARTAVGRVKGKTLVGKTPGEPIFEIKSVFEGVSRPKSSGLDIFAGKFKTKLGKETRSKGVSKGEGFDIDVRVDLISGTPTSLKAVSAKGKGFVTKEVTRSVPFEKEVRLTLGKSKVKSKATRGDDDFFGSTTVAFGTEKEVGVASFSNVLLPKVGGGFRPTRVGGFKSEGSFKLDKKPKSKSLSVGKTFTQTKTKPAVTFSDLLSSKQKLEVTSFASKKLAPPISQAKSTKRIGAVAAVTKSSTGPDLFRGVPVSQFQGTGQFEKTIGGSLPGQLSLTQPSLGEAPSIFQPLKSGLFSNQVQAFGISSRSGQKVSPILSERSLIDQSQSVSPLFKQAPKLKQTQQTKQVQKTRQASRFRSPTAIAGFGLAPKAGAFGAAFPLIPLFSRTRQGSKTRRSPSQFSLSIGRSPSLDAIGLGIFGSKASGEFSGAGSLVSRPILLSSPTKKKKKRRKKK